jgi:hypothetical protein
MNLNPFSSSAWNPTEENLDTHPAGASASANVDHWDRGRTDEEIGFARRPWRFLHGIGYLIVVFLALVFSVFREVKHSRELYQMNQLIATADAQRRQWQEAARLDEAQKARLMAEVMRLQSLRREASTGNAADNLAALQP